MANKRLTSILVLAGFLCLVFSVAAFGADLTGDWGCNDGGTYYIRQDGSSVWWYGEIAPENPSWSNVAYGEIVGNQLHLKWADVPKGSVGGKGRLVLEVRDNGRRLQALKKEGSGFGGSSWTKKSSGF